MLGSIQQMVYWDMNKSNISLAEWEGKKRYKKKLRLKAIIITGNNSNYIIPGSSIIWIFKHLH